MSEESAQPRFSFHPIFLVATFGAAFRFPNALREVADLFLGRFDLTRGGGIRDNSAMQTRRTRDRGNSERNGREAERVPIHKSILCKKVENMASLNFERLADKNPPVPALPHYSSAAASSYSYSCPVSSIGSGEIQNGTLTTGFGCFPGCTRNEARCVGSFVVWHSLKSKIAEIKMIVRAALSKNIIPWPNERINQNSLQFMTTR